MIKVKMVNRHTADSGEKLERGLSYLLPRSYAQELIDHGLAVLVIPGSSPVNVTPEPTKTVTMATALRKMRAKNQDAIESESKPVIREGKKLMEAENGTEKKQPEQTED